MPCKNCPHRAAVRPDRDAYVHARAIERRGSQDRAEEGLLAVYRELQWKCPPPEALPVINALMRRVVGVTA